MEKISVSHRIKRLINEIGFSCDLKLSVTLINDKYSIEWDENLVLNSYHLAVIGGCQYFIDHYPKDLSFFINDIELKSLHDASYSIVFYSTVKALSDFFNYSIDDFSINNKGKIVMPK